MARKRKKMVGYENHVVAYLRYSTRNQTDLSIEYQRETVERYCAKQGYTLVKFFIDEAKTGTNNKRDALKNMIDEALHEPHWSRIVVFSFNRFARNTDYNGYYKVQLEQVGVTIESATQDNSDTPEARFLRNSTAAYDAYMPECCSIHTHAAMATKASKCLHCGGIPPLGFELKNEKLVVNAYEAETVRLIFAMYSKNYSYSDMVKVLNNKGLTTKTGNPFKKTSFNSILQQEKYMGIYVWNRATGKDSEDRHNNHESKPLDEQVRVEGGCEAIIDAATFEAVQQRMKSNKRSNTSSNGNHHYMFGGMQKIYCAECGALMVGSVYKSHGKSYRYYICPNHKGGGCSTKNIRARYVEHFVVSHLMNNLFKRSMIGNYNNLIATVNSSTSCAGLKKELNGVKRSIANLLTVLQKCPTDDVTERLELLNAKKIGIIERINAVSTPPSIKPSDFKEVGKALAHELKHSVDPIIYDLIDASVGSIKVSNDDIEVELNV